MIQQWVLEEMAVASEGDDVVNVVDAFVDKSVYNYTTDHEAEQEADQGKQSTASKTSNQQCDAHFKASVTPVMLHCSTHYFLLGKFV